MGSTRALLLVLFVGLFWLKSYVCANWVKTAPILPSENVHDTDVLLRFKERRGRSIVYFMHMKKAGGTALCDTVSNRIRTPGGCNCEICNHSDVSRSRETRLFGTLAQQRSLFSEISGQYDFVATEHPLPLEFDTSLGRPWIYVTNLRHPIEAYWSHVLHNVDYVRRTTTDGLNMSHVSLETIQYAQQPLKTNLQRDRLRFVPGRLVFAITGVTHTRSVWDVSKITRISIDDLATKSEHEIMMLLLAEAKNRLKHFSAILTRENFREDLDVMFKRLGLPHVAIDNSRSSRNTHKRIFEETFYKNDPELRALFHQTFRYDIDLFRYGVELAKRLRESVP